MYLEEAVPWLGGEGEPEYDESKKTEKAFFEEYEGVSLDYHGIEVLETAVERFGKDGISERGKEAQKSTECKKV